MPRPKIPKDQHAVSCGFSLPGPLLATAQKRAFDKGRSFSMYMQELILADVRKSKEAKNK